MKRISHFSIASLLAALAIALGAAGCSKKAATIDGNIDYYTCTMHPSVHAKEPGKCPICSMDLVPVYKKTATAQAASASSAKSGPAEFAVPVERQQQIGVTYATVEPRHLRATVRAAGTVSPEVNLLYEYVSRVDGYVEKLDISSEGETVKRGQPLMSLYSPDLLTTEWEFIAMLGPGGSDSARRKLQLLNIEDQEINELAKTRKPSEFLTLRSPFDGIVTSVAVKPGASIKTGDRLISVADLSNVWLWADFYEEELPLLVPGRQITAIFSAYPNEQFSGTVAVVDPILDSATRTTRVRIDIPNPKWSLRPGMYAEVELNLDGGNLLSIPASAVLPTGTRFLVFVDKGEGKLEPRFVKLGREFQSADSQSPERYYAVTGGLTEGERVVASGNFLIDAESKIQSALQTWDTDER